MTRFPIARPTSCQPARSSRQRARACSDASHERLVHPAPARRPVVLSLTRAQTAIGTPNSAAPATLPPWAKPDPPAELYPLGVTLHQMLTGAFSKALQHQPNCAGIRGPCSEMGFPPEHLRPFRLGRPGRERLGTGVGCSEPRLPKCRGLHGPDFDYPPAPSGVG